ncbi:hypothetical protein ACQKMY_21685 [Peribacillus frigoritolerans]|uniref:hypothetical protein n=1 Tax=Peribacillus frigoritolerans TaxID=450367 RepID=UPI003D032DDA
MYIWNINKLVKVLQEGTITNKQKKRYRRFFWVIFTLSVLAYPVVYNPSTMNGYDDVIDLILTSIIDVIAIYLFVGSPARSFLPFPLFNDSAIMKIIAIYSKSKNCMMYLYRSIKS